MSQFRLGVASEANFAHVEPGLVLCARDAIETTTQDFGVFEGERTLIRQHALVAAGASRTLDSYHIKDAEGVVRALDLVPYVLGRLQWQTPLCNQVARAMHRAAVARKVLLVWGRVWDRLFNELDPDDFDHERALYVQRYQATHPPQLVHGVLKPQYPLDDGPHFQGLRASDKRAK